jgi:hypothetical protein
MDIRKPRRGVEWCEYKSWKKGSYVLSSFSTGPYGEEFILLHGHWTAAKSAHGLEVLCELGIFFLDLQMISRGFQVHVMDKYNDVLLAVYV